MRLYVANLSGQRHEFLYRKPEDTRVHMEAIPPGEQRLVVDDMREVVRSIVDQHARFGLVSVSAMIRQRVVTALCYQYDKPVPLDAMLTANEANRQFQAADAAERRKEVAIAAADAAEQAARLAGLPSPRRFSVGIKEVPKDLRDTTAFDETIHVDAEGTEPRRGPIDWTEAGFGSA